MARTTIHIDTAEVGRRLHELARHGAIGKTGVPEAGLHRGMGFGDGSLPRLGGVGRTGGVG